MTNPPGLTCWSTAAFRRRLNAVPNGATCPTTSSQLSGLAPPGFAQLCTGDFDFLPYSVHTVGANTPQQDQAGNYWVFEGYTTASVRMAVTRDGRADQRRHHAHRRFVAGVKVTLITSQPGLQLTVDGRSNWQGYNFVWGKGNPHHRRSATQVDSQGPHVVVRELVQRRSRVADADRATTTTNLALTANFVMQPQVTLNSVPAGYNFRWTEVRAPRRAWSARHRARPCSRDSGLDYVERRFAPRSDFLERRLERHHAHRHV